MPAALEGKLYALPAALTAETQRRRGYATFFSSQNSPNNPVHLSEPIQCIAPMTRIQLLACFLFLLLLPPCFAQQADPGTITPKETKLLIDSLGNALNRWYVYPEQAAAMMNQVRKNYKNGAYKTVRDRFELSNRLLKDLQQAHHDGHLDMAYDPAFATLLETPMTEDDRVKGYEQDLNDAREHNFGFVKTEVLSGNIGYVRVDAFPGLGEEAKPTLNAALQFVRNCKAVIIDLRYNGGGSPDMVLQVESYFFRETTRMNDIIDRNNDTLKRWTDPATSAFQLEMPVYILTHRNTFSGAEDFAYGMQQTQRAVVVGDTTGGGAHPTGAFSIGQGFVVYIPTHRSYNIHTQTDWEGTGVRPDVAVPSEQALTKAQALIYMELLAKTTDEREKDQLQWQLSSMEHRASMAEELRKTTILLAPETLLAYSGDYIALEPNPTLTSLSIVLRDNELYRQYDDRHTVRLIPISPTQLVYSDETGRTLDFVTNAQGEVIRLVLTRQDGSHILTKKK
jgi:hypothetical protein